MIHTQDKNNDGDDKNAVRSDVAPEVTELLLDVAQDTVGYQRPNVDAPVEPVEVSSHCLRALVRHLYSIQ